MPEYVESMWLMLQQGESDDYVIATGEAHSVREFCEVAFDIVGVNKRFMRPLDVNYLCGDYSKAKEKLGWKPKTKFKNIMVKEDLGSMVKNSHGIKILIRALRV